MIMMMDSCQKDRVLALCQGLGDPLTREILRSLVICCHDMSASFSALTKRVVWLETQLACQLPQLDVERELQGQLRDGTADFSADPAGCLPGQPITHISDFSQRNLRALDSVLLPLARSELTACLNRLEDSAFNHILSTPQQQSHTTSKKRRAESQGTVLQHLSPYESPTSESSRSSSPVPKKKKTVKNVPDPEWKLTVCLGKKVKRKQAKQGKKVSARSSSGGKNLQPDGNGQKPKELSMNKQVLHKGLADSNQEVCQNGDAQQPDSPDTPLCVNLEDGSISRIIGQLSVVSTHPGMEDASRPLHGHQPAHTLGHSLAHLENELPTSQASPAKKNLNQAFSTPARKKTAPNHSLQEQTSKNTPSNPGSQMSENSSHKRRSCAYMVSPQANMESPFHSGPWVVLDRLNTTDAQENNTLDQGNTENPSEVGHTGVDNIDDEVNFQDPSVIAGTVGGMTVPSRAASLTPDEEIIFNSPTMQPADWDEDAGEDPTDQEHVADAEAEEDAQDAAAVKRAKRIKDTVVKALKVGLGRAGEQSLGRKQAKKATGSPRASMLSQPTVGPGLYKSVQICVKDIAYLLSFYKRLQKFFTSEHQRMRLKPMSPAQALQRTKLLRICRLEVDMDRNKIIRQKKSRAPHICDLERVLHSCM